MLLRAQSFDSSTIIADFNSRCASSPVNCAIKQPGAFGGNYLSQDGQYYQMAFVQGFPAIRAGTTGYLGLRYRPFNSQGRPFSVNILDGSGRGHVGIAITQAGQPSIALLNNNDPSTVLFNGTIGQVPAGWSFVEFGWSISATATGTVEMRVNGQVLFKSTTVVTQGVGSADTSSLGYYFFGGGDAQDIYVADSTGPAPGNTFLGDLRVLEMAPTGPGASTAFAPTGAATNWQVAAQALPAPATIFNASSVVGAADLYVAAPLPTGLGVIFGVQVTGMLSKADAGARVATMSIKSGAVGAAGASHALQTTPVVYNDVFAVDPATGAAFTAAGVNTLQFGPTIVS